MTASNPIIPPGSPLQRSRPGRNPKLVVTVFAILAVHVLLLSGLLIQGCKREDKNAAGTSDASATATVPNDTSRGTAPSFTGVPSAQQPAQMSPAPEVASAQSTGSVVVVSEPNLPKMDQTSSAPRAAAGASSAAVKYDGPVSVYVVKPGDNLTRIAKAHGTTAKAIREASGLKTDRILVGQKLKVPQGTAAASVESTSPTSSTK
jgi:LysM repeat protein